MPILQIKIRMYSFLPFIYNNKLIFLDLLLYFLLYLLLYFLYKKYL
jgi:hypothetical protein